MRRCTIIIIGMRESEKEMEKKRKKTDFARIAKSDYLKAP